MSIVDDILAKSKQEYEKRGYNQEKNVGTYIKNVTPENSNELKELLQFIEECGFSSSLLKTNMQQLSICVDEYQANKGYSTKGKIVINSLENKDTILHEMIHQASSDFEYGDSGIKTFDEQGSLDGVALNEGITEYITRFINPNYKIDYEAEYLVAKRLIEAFGIEQTLEGYFEADRMIFEYSFGEENYKYITNIIKLLDKYEEIMSKEQNINNMVEIANIFDLINAYLGKMNIETIDFTDKDQLSPKGNEKEL